MKKIIILIIYASLFFQGNTSFAQLNEDFENAPCLGNGAFAGSNTSSCTTFIPNWIANSLSPSINLDNTLNTNYAWMWSYSGRGESISIPFNFVQGQSYTVSFNLRTDLMNNNSATAALQNGQVYLVATNNPGGPTGNPGGNTIWNQSIGGGNYYQNWQAITTTFTPTANRSQLWIYPFWGVQNNNGNQVEMSIDNVVITCRAPQNTVNFHFEHEDGTEDTVFNICEDVYLDGSLTLNTGSYFMDIWRVNTDNTLSWLSAKGVNGWTNGQPNLVNVTQTFENDVENPVTFQAGVTYEVKLAVSHPSCGWTSLTHRFTYVEASISSLFDIDGYNCHDGVYDVTVTAQDTFPSQWWRVYETSVEGQTDDSVTIGSASSIHGGTTTTFTNLDPDKFYYIKHGVWVDGCIKWQETRTPLDRDCCIDNPQIEPYWEYCSSKNLCDLDTWPIRVVDENGNPITGSDGVQFSWVSSNGGSSISDVVYTVAFEEWTLTLTYPDGCIYIRTYKKICCEEDIHIEIDECPTEGEIATLEQQVQTERSQLSDESYIKYVNAIKSYKERTINAKVACNPCDNGTVVMRVVDANGNLITNFISITWGDGLFPNSNVRIGDVNVTYTVTVVVSVNGGQDRCIYTDTFIYECPCDLPAPTNVHLHGTSFLHWNAVPGAVGYIVSPSLVWDRTCTCSNPISIRPIETRNNYTNLLFAEGTCYMVRVAAICADGSISEYSEDICIGGGKGIKGGDTKKIREVSITPNPTKGEMTFNVTTSMDTEVTIAIYDTYGTLVKSFVQQVTSDDTSSISWDGSNLRKGIYFINFKTKEETIYKQIIVK